jgi:predicted nucleotidyltransferase
MDFIVKMKFGSHLYGTDTEDSDVDYKGVFLPSKNEILLNTVPKCRSFSTNNGQDKNNPGDIDEEIYSLHYFIKLACDGQTVAMDMLHAPESMLLKSTEIWRSIVKQKNRFYTKNLNSFIQYARRQASKYGIKGSRLNAAAQVIDFLKSHNSEIRLRNVWNQLPTNEYCHEMDVDPNGMRQYQVCGKMFQESSSIGYILPIISKFYDDYGHRAKLAAENKNIDWKALSHALRAALQTKEILTDGTITFPLKDAPFLLKVKSGQLDYTNEVAPALESLMDEVESLVTKSDLPEKVDIDYWNHFICETIEKSRFKAL